MMPERLLKRSLRLEALLAGITVPRRITYTATKRPCEACGGNGGRVSENSGQIPRHCETCDGTGEASQENA